VGIGGAFVAEWRRVLATRGAFILLVLAPLIYGIYYPQPYLTQILRKVPIVQTLDASGAASVAVRTSTLGEAQAAINRGEVFAAVRIPPGTERDVLKGANVHNPIYADATYLFIFRTTANGIATAIATHSSELAAGGARTDSSLVKAKLAAVNPADILLQPIYNPVGGYASYIVPAAFVLILQQLLVIGSAMLTCVTLAEPSFGNPFAQVLGRGIAHLVIFLPALVLCFFVLPRVYGFSTLGHPLQLIALGAVFALSTSFLGQAVGAWFEHPDTPTLIFLGTSLPQFFLAGFSWPREAIPEFVQTVSNVFPADLAIDGIVRLNQMGASLWEVARDWQGLWRLAVIYFLLAVISAAIVKRRRVVHDGH
jgi:ABC-2 type transport system permease protein